MIKLVYKTIYIIINITITITIVFIIYKQLNIDFSNNHTYIVTSKQSVNTNNHT